MDGARALRARLLRWVAVDRGAVATEYGLTLLLITLAIVVAATLFGITLSGLYEDTGGAFPGASGS